MNKPAFIDPSCFREWRCDESLWQLALDSSNASVWFWDCQTDALSCSRNGLALLGYADGEIGRCRADWVALVCPADLPDVRAALENHLCGKAPIFEAVFRIRARSGEWRWLLSRGSVVDWTLTLPRSAAQVIGTVTEITAIKESQRRLEYQVNHDSLTGLPNRLMMGVLAEHVLACARRTGSRLALLLLDLDRFQDINDSNGHAAGDEVLVQVSARLRSCLRGVDTICRLGGDEFTVLLEVTHLPDDVAIVSEELIKELSVPYALTCNREAVVGASIGVAVFPEHGNTLEELLQHADTALYRAKAQGRAGFVIFTDALTRVVQARVDLEARLRRAISGNELRLYFQPQAEMASGRIVGAEALIRWENADGGVTSPRDFIPVAEETGLIDAIGRWVLREACRQGKAWRDRGLPPITLAVNISPRELRHGDLTTRLVETLMETGYSADGLELELTETAVMEWGDELAEQLQRVRALGVRVALDDFGTGYSSLGRLKRLPLDMLKIDKSFVDDIPQSRNDMEIAATIIGMSKTLCLDVLAEGVETEEQFAFLKGRGCHKYQGYYLSPPLPPEAFVQLLFSSCAPNDCALLPQQKPDRRVYPSARMTPR